MNELLSFQSPNSLDAKICTLGYKSERYDNKNIVKILEPSFSKILVQASYDQLSNSD